MRTATKARARQLGSFTLRMSEWERRDWRDRAERAGWRPGETCDCADPMPGFGGGDRFYITGVCVRCHRRLRRA